MKADKIIPCVCIEHEPTTADSVYYGMPQLKVSKGQEWTAYCPNCGRGGCGEYTSSYKALRAWNELQDGLRNCKCW